MFKNRQIPLKPLDPPRRVVPQPQSNSINIFGAFDPDNQYSHIFEAQLRNKSTPSNEPYSQQPCVNNEQDIGPQYSYSSYNKYQGTLSCPPVQYSYDYNYNPSEYSMSMYKVTLQFKSSVVRLSRFLLSIIFNI